MARQYLYSNLTPDQWDQKAGSGWCAVCDAQKQLDTICCNFCWLHLKEVQQAAIINLLRKHNPGVALKKMCIMAGRAKSISRNEIKKRTLPLFAEVAR